MTDWLISAWKVFMFQVAVTAHLCLFKYLSRQVPYAFTLASPLVEPLLICWRTRSDVCMLRKTFFLSLWVSEFPSSVVSFLQRRFIKCLWAWQIIDLCMLLVVKVSVTITNGTVHIIQPKKFSSKKPWKIKYNSST